MKIPKSFRPDKNLDDKMDELIEYSKTVIEGDPDDYLIPTTFGYAHYLEDSEDAKAEMKTVMKIMMDVPPFNDESTSRHVHLYEDDKGFFYFISERKGFKIIGDIKKYRM